MIDLIDIVKSWSASFNPTDDQLAEAEHRLLVCRSCEWIKTDVFERCGYCGCPLKAKVFSENGCPEGKW